MTYEAQAQAQALMSRELKFLAFETRGPMLD
jgi:hypothetical protein